MIWRKLVGINIYIFPNIQNMDNCKLKQHYTASNSALCIPKLTYIFYATIAFSLDIPTNDRVTSSIIKVF